MRLTDTICMLLISLLIASSTLCLAEESSPSDVNPALPTTMLPEGFKLLAALPEMDPSVDMNDYITDFYGDREIEPVNISVGIYQWDAKEGKAAYDAKITYIRMADEEQAEDAIENFKSQDDYVAQQAEGLEIFGNATVNDHEALEIKHIRNDNSIKYLYLWNNIDLVVLVEGNNNQNQSLELAEATGL